MANPKVIRLTTSGHMMSVTPPVPELDDGILATRLVPVVAPGGWVECRPVATPVVGRFSDPDRLRRVAHLGQATFAGVADRVAEVATRAGHRVEREGEFRPLPEPADREYTDRRVVQFVACHGRGIIAYDPVGRVRPHRLLADVILAWPNAHFAVASSDIRTAVRFHKALSSCGVTAELLTGRHPVKMPARVIVTTPAFLPVQNRNAGPTDDRIVVVLDPARWLRGEGAFEGTSRLVAVERARLFGIMPVGEKLGRRDRELLPAVFGPARLVVRGYGRRDRFVRFVFIPIDGGTDVRSIHDTQAVIANGVVGHAVRNRRLVRLARALASNDRATLGRDFPMLAKLADTVNGRVVVLVERIDHGLGLAAKLGWPMVAAADVVEDGLSAEDRAALAAGRDADRVAGRPVVATPAGLDRVGRVDTVIRADGGVGLPELPRGLTIAAVGDNRPITIVDVRDGHHPQLRRRAADRRAAYLAAGWVEERA